MMSYFIALVKFDVFKDLFSPLWTFEEHVLQITIVFLWNCKKIIHTGSNRFDWHVKEDNKGTNGAAHLICNFVICLT